MWPGPGTGEVQQLSIRGGVQLPGLTFQHFQRRARLPPLQAARSLGPDRCRSAFPICPLTVHTAAAAAAGGDGDGDGGGGGGGVGVGGGAAESTSGRVLPGWEHFHFAHPAIV